MSDGISDKEADVLVEASKQGVLDNRALASLIQNIYGRLQKVEAKSSEAKTKKEKKTKPSASGGP